MTLSSRTPLTRKTPLKTGKSCNCLEQVQKQLKELNTEIVQGFQLNFATGKMKMSMPLIQVRKIDKKKRDMTTIICSHCPFCGRKYPA